ncbi:major facilitator superfamily domain-containing protein [Exophiala viscosa]|uniref:major facilitator superfamily domain-containing protein n=1 Tax=Exophiala viscosa TaxID=2486360 RepID=UPI002197232D|nr:major facilitator superfamily domain-containing protein [Exophiala viscosa]
MHEPIENVQADVFQHEPATAGEVTSIDDKKLLRKIDWLLMPLMFSVYYLQYTDKTLLSTASVMGVIEDTHMPANGFSHLAMTFYVSFLVCEPLQSTLIQKFPTAQFLGINVTIWGVVVTMNCVCKGFAPLVVLRVLLGVFESCVAPSLIILTSMWYTRFEQTLRMGIWYQGSSIAPIVSTLASYGFLFYDKKHDHDHFKSWQILFLLFGLLTIAIGILVFFFLPNSPMKSRFSHAEKVAILERVRDNETGIENKHLKWKQVKEVLLDVKTWMMSLIVILTNVPNGAVSSFNDIIISNFGYSDAESLLQSLPGCAVAFFSVWWGTWAAGRYNCRGLVIIALIIPTLLGGALMAWLPANNKSGLLAGINLINTVGSNASANEFSLALPLLYSWVTANYAGHSKKITMNAILLMSFCLGNIIGPETFQDSDAPQYIPAKMTIVITLAIAIVITLGLAAMYHLENKRRDRAGYQEMPEDYQFLDLTDKQTRNFRYLL